MDQHYWLDTYAWYLYSEMSPGYMSSWNDGICESIRTYCNL
jgi:hypothetical protein